MLQYINADNIHGYLPKVQHYVELILAKNPFQHTVDEIVASVLLEDLKLFAMVQDGEVKGVLLLQTFADIGKLCLNIWGMAHDTDYLDEDKDSEQVMEIAKLVKARYVTYFGRKGFLKRNKSKGWVEAQTIMFKEVL